MEDLAIIELKEKLRESEDFKERTRLHLQRMAKATDRDMESALDREVNYYITEGYFLREMAHSNKLSCCQYDNGKCVICGGFELENSHPNFR